MTKTSLLLVLVLTVGCDRERVFAVQNYFGETAEVIIEFEEEQTEVLPEVRKLIKGNQIRLLWNCKSG